MTIDNANHTHHIRRQRSLRREQPTLLSCYKYLTAKITVNHWQLRDLIQPTARDRNEILYTFDDTIRATDRSTDKVSTVCKLDFQPRCFDESDGNIVSGGVVGSMSAISSSTTEIVNTFGSGSNSVDGSNWRGLFSFYNRDQQTSSTIRLGCYINNNVSLNKVSNNQYTSYVCNNDMSLYIAGVSNSRVSVLDSVNLLSPLNHSILSDDHKSLVAVGDCSRIFLLHPGQEGSRSLRTDHVIETNCDSGFSTSFNGAGTQFATCFQDGTCLVYDIRNYTKGPLHEIYSTRRNTSNGAFRCAKFSRGTDDLLVLSEHVGRVHVIDTRDYKNHQVIMLPMNTLEERSRQSSHSSLQSLNSRIDEQVPSEAIITPKILNYHDVLDYEGNFNPNYTSEIAFRNRNNYNSRSLNNFQVLSALEAETRRSSRSSSPNSLEDTSNPLHSSTYGDYSNGQGSEYEYTDNEISGIDWYEDDMGSHIVIGCDRGLINWDIDSWSRRSFPSFSLA